MTTPDLSPYSDAALAKQAEWDRIEAAGGKPPLSLLYGIAEPRVKPTADERCHCCGLDARPEWGGNGTHCSVCIERGHDD